MNNIIKRITPETYEKIIQESGAALNAGRIVGIPTETVYGLAANNDSKDALSRLILLKNRPPAKLFTRHLSDRSELFEYAPDPRDLAKKLMDRYWPGPLTLVLDTAQGKSIGVRIPGLELTRRIIQASGVPVVIPSANFAGERPACSATEVAHLFSEKIDLIVDDGKTKLGDTSTVVKVSNNSISILREGIINKADIIKTASVKVLFICTGNTCRSPMAEGIFKKMMADKLNCTIPELPYYGFLIQSAGISSPLGGKPSINAVRALDKWNIDIKSHKTRLLSKNLIQSADHVFVMTNAHRENLWSMMGLKTPNIKLLDQKERDILDPFGGSNPVYAQCASQIYTNILEIIEKL